MKKTMIKKIILCMLAITLCVALCACSEIKISTGKEADVLVDVEGVTSSKEDAYFLLMETILTYQSDMSTGYFWDVPVGNQDIKDYIKESIKEQIIKFTACEVLADKKAVYLTDEEIENAKLIAKKSFEDVSKNFNVAKYNVTEANAVNIYLKSELYNKLYDNLTAETKASVTEEDTKVIVVNYIELPVNTNSSEATELWEKVKATNDLEKCATEGGYKFHSHVKMKKGTVNSSFDEVAFALFDNEISEVVESKDGLYIIECVDDKVIADSTANYNMQTQKKCQEAFDEIYNNFAKETHLYFNKGLWNKIDVKELLK